MRMKFDKDFDLEPTEYRREDQPEPFWGYNAKHIGILFALSFPIGAIMTRIIYGDWPYWVEPLLALGK
jgi:hypothetical protein